jgi:hypothetical protein
MSIWKAQTTVMARPEAVLDVLTDPRACARWAPVPFDVEGWTRRGSWRGPGPGERPARRPAGRFDVEVHEAHHGRLSLAASGPVGFDVSYELAEAAAGSEMRARVDVRAGSGLTGRLMAHATGALLAAGALDTAVARIAREAAAT